jgi:hypothetical protein
MNKKILISGLLMAAVTVYAAAEPKYISPNNDVWIIVQKK